MATLHCVAFEYVNPGCEPGGGGYNWYLRAQDADAAFIAGERSADHAWFRFDVDMPEEFDDLDVDYVEESARARRRWIGDNVLRYWRRNDMRMGGAKRPSPRRRL